MNIKNVKIKVFDMTCTSCERRVETAVKKLTGVISAKASFSGQYVLLEYDLDQVKGEEIKQVIKNAGYSTESKGHFKLVGIAIIAAAIILIGNNSTGIDMTSKLSGASYLVLFIVGVLTSIHCVGMCGGIMLTQSIVKDGKSKFDSVKPAILYNAGRVTSYTILGGVVGALGSVFALSISVKAALQLFAGIFMIIMGLNMSGFSLFRKFNFKLPWSACKLKIKPKTPYLVGILNGLMPCGPLQTMQLYALGTGSLTKGALSMFLFSIGTVPLMLTFGALSGFISKGYTKTLLKFSGILIVVLGIIMGSRGLSLAGINVPTPSSIVQAISSSASAATPGAKATIENGVQIIRMTADGSGYTPNGFYVEKNKPVKWIIDGKALNSCNGQIIVPSLNIQKNLKPGENIIEFTPKTSDISFSCGMGMIRGVIKVVDSLSTVDATKPDVSIPAPSSGMACCGGDGTTSSTSTSSQTASIYGNDLSKVSSARLVHKAVLSSNTQKATIKGTGSEFEPMIIVVQKGLNSSLSFDLSNFTNPSGYFNLISADTGKNILTFTGKKGIVNINYTFSSSGTFGISKAGNAIAAVVVVDSLVIADTNEIRNTYLTN